jgi:diphthamide synthase subunit DPH2
LEVIHHCQLLIRKAGKKSYVFSVGKPNVSKLGNYPDVDMFVLVACPFTALLDSMQFMQDVMTPFELELALAPYVVDAFACVCVCERGVYVSLRVCSPLAASKECIVCAVCVFMCM